MKRLSMEDKNSLAIGDGSLLRIDYVDDSVILSNSDSAHVFLKNDIPAFTKCLLSISKLTHDNSAINESL